MCIKCEEQVRNLQISVGECKELNDFPELNLIVPNKFVPANNEQAESRFNRPDPQVIVKYIKEEDLDFPINHTPTHRINLFSPRFHFHYARNEWYAIIVNNSRGWFELIVRTSHGVPYDSYYRLRKVFNYVEPVSFNN